MDAGQKEIESDDDINEINFENQLKNIEELVKEPEVQRDVVENN